MNLVDKNAIMQVIGCLIRNPLLFSEIGNDINIDDFDTNFTKSIFNAIYNLYQLGADKVTIIDIDNYLQQYGGIYSNFTKENGITYLQDCCELAQVENFYYYFNRLKKFSALRKLNKNGIDVSSIYDDDIDDPKKEKEQLDAFEAMSVQDIFSLINKKISNIEYQYSVGKQVSCSATENIKELKEELKQSPEIGAPLQGEIYNVIVRGARKGKFYLNSGASGSGKSRKLIGNACKLAYPFHYDETKNEWVKSGSSEKTLIITTELERDEVQTIILACLSGVNEEHILYGVYASGEEERVDAAIKEMQEHQNLFIESIPDPNINQIKVIIKRHVAMNQIVNVMYDYIFSSPNLLGEFRDLRIREDTALMMLSTALKDLAVEYNLYVESGTQLSGDYDGWEGVRNQTLIRGAKSIVDKCDVGAITSPAQDRDITALTPMMREYGYPNPTHVMDIYKLRRGRYKNVRIWGILDLGTGRWIDLFVTDGNYRVIPINAPKVIFNTTDMVDFNVKESMNNTKEANEVVIQNKVESAKKSGWDYL